MTGTRRYDLLTFDVYTALFDVEGSLTPVVRDALGASADAREIVRAWRRKQLEFVLISGSLQRGHVSFATLTRRALDYVLGREGRELGEGVRRDLVQAWDRLQPWPEAAPVLSELQARGHRLALLSNGDYAMLQALAARLPVAWQAIFASDRAHAYKPNPTVYLVPLRTLGLAPTQVLHVAGSATDVMGAKAAGLPCVWSNRHHDLIVDPALMADREIADLRGLLDLV
jgi:2-haloacid dehalogenase